MTEPTWIASTEVVVVTADGARIPGSVRVSAPQPAFEHDAECRYSIPLQDPYDVRGHDETNAASGLTDESAIPPRAAKTRSSAEASQSERAGRDTLRSDT